MRHAGNKFDLKDSTLGLIYSSGANMRYNKAACSHHRRLPIIDRPQQLVRWKGPPFPFPFAFHRYQSSRDFFCAELGRVLRRGLPQACAALITRRLTRKIGKGKRDGGHGHTHPPETRRYGWLQNPTTGPGQHCDSQGCEGHWPLEFGSRQHMPSVALELIGTLAPGGGLCLADYAALCV